MADIPVVQMPQQPRTSGNPVLADPNAAAAPYRALTQVGNAVAGLGQQAYAYAKQKQKLRDESAVSENNLWNRDTADKIKTAIAENPYEHEKWAGIADDSWAKREEGLNQYIQEKGVSEEAAEVMRNRLQMFRDDSVNAATLKATTRENELQYTAVILDANEYYRNEQWDAGDARIDSLGLDERMADRIKTEEKKKGEYQRVRERLQLANTIDEYDAFIEDLEKREGAGKAESFVNYDYLEPQQRGQLKNYAIARKQAMQKGAALKAIRAEELVARGDYTDQDREQLVIAGVDPEVIEAIDNAADTRAVLEEDTDKYKDILDNIELQTYENIFYPGNWNQGQRNKNDFLKIQKRIANADDLSPQSKRKLTGEWIKAWYSDVSDGILELGTGENIELDDKQQQFYNGIFQTYQLANEEGTIDRTVLASRMAMQIEDFVTWYDSQPEEPTELMVNEKLREYSGQLSGLRALERARQMAEELESGDMWSGQ